MSAHYLQNEGPLVTAERRISCQGHASQAGLSCSKWLHAGVPLRRGGDGIHNLDDAMQGRVRPDGHVGATEVVINGAHHANDVEMGGTLGLVGCDLT